MDTTTALVFLASALFGGAIVGAIAGILSQCLDVFWKLSGVTFLVLFCCTAFLFAQHRMPRLSPTLLGATQLIFALDRDGSKNNVTSAEMAAAIDQRIRDLGTVATPVSDEEVMVTLYEDRPETIALIKRLLSQTGNLEFRILVDEYVHPDIVSYATEDRQKTLSIVSDDEGREIAKWVAIGRDQETNAMLVSLESNHVFRHAKTKQWLSEDFSNAVNRQFSLDKSQEKIDGPEVDSRNADIRQLSIEDLIGKFAKSTQYIRNADEPQLSFDDWLEKIGNPEIEVLTLTDRYPVLGSHLTYIDTAFDSVTLAPKIEFGLSDEGAKWMELLTSENLPRRNERPSRLGIVLDNVLLSAPGIAGVISDSGQITGRFSMEEIDYMAAILRAGKLPMPLKKSVVSESRIEPHSIFGLSCGQLIAVFVVLQLLIVIAAVACMRFSAAALAGSSLIHAWLMFTLAHLSDQEIGLNSVAVWCFGGLIAAAFNFGVLFWTRSESARAEQQINDARLPWLLVIGIHCLVAVTSFVATRQSEATIDTWSWSILIAAMTAVFATFCCWVLRDLLHSLREWKNRPVSLQPKC